MNQEKGCQKQLSPPENIAAGMKLVKESSQITGSETQRL